MQRPNVSYCDPLRHVTDFCGAREGAAPPEDFIRHIGREYGIIIQGTLSVQVGFGRAEMHVGDSIAFDSSIPHRFSHQTAQRHRGHTQRNAHECAVRDRCNTMHVD